MKGNARRLVYFANLLLTSGVVVVVTNCGGGERPAVSSDLIYDASSAPTAPTSDGGTSAVVVSGYDSAAGILFGDNGFTNCGTQAPDKVISLKNTTADIVNFEARLTSGNNYYKISPQSGGVPTKGQATI
jgi:hypothetical protein